MSLSPWRKQVWLFRYRIPKRSNVVPVGKKLNTMLSLVNHIKTTKHENITYKYLNDFLNT